MRDNVYKELDWQIDQAQNNLAYFKKSLENAAKGASAFPTANDLEEQLKKINDSKAFKTLVMSIRNDMTFTSQQTRGLNLEALISQLKTTSERRPKFNPDGLERQKFVHDVVNDKIVPASLLDSKTLMTDISCVTVAGELLAKPEHKELLRAWLPTHLSSAEFGLIYSNKLDGKGRETIHKALEGKRNTILIYRTETGKVLGGFMDDDWTKHEQYFDGKQTFLFSFDTKRRYLPDPYKLFYDKDDIKDHKTPNGYFDTNKYGPCFGRDLYIHPETFVGWANEGVYYLNYKDITEKNEWNCDTFEIYRCV